MIKELSLLEFKQVYKGHVSKDFPEDELKPLEVLEEEKERGIALFLGYFNEEQLLGYAVIQKGERALLLDYFAICKAYRQHGLGLAFLKELQEYCKDWDALLIESETAINTTAQKRLDFYQKAGARITGCKLYLYFVDYHVLVLPISKDYSDKEAYQHLQQIYDTLYPKEFSSQYLKLVL